MTNDPAWMDDLDRHHLANLRRLEIDPEPFITSRPDRADRRRELATEAPGWPHSTRVLKRGWVRWPEVESSGVIEAA